MVIIKEHINRKNYKKIYFALLGMLLVFFCCSCQRGQQEEIPEVITSDKIIYDMAVISVDGEFYNIIANNPIDNAFVSEDVGAEQRIQAAVARCNQWSAEIKYTLDILEEFLSKEDYQALVLAYDEWQQYLQNTISVEQSLFYIGSPYKSENGTIIGCNDTYPQVMEAAALRMRNYAVELMSIEYAFTGNVKFAINEAVP